MQDFWTTGQEIRACFASGLSRTSLVRLFEQTAEPLFDHYQIVLSKQLYLRQRRQVMILGIVSLISSFWGDNDSPTFCILKHNLQLGRQPGKGQLGNSLPKFWKTCLVDR